METLRSSTDGVGTRGGWRTWTYGPHASQTLIVVEGVVPVDETDLNDVRAKVWSYALDQRAFGPRKLMVAFTEANGRLRVLAHATRTSNPLLSFEACLDHLGRGAAAAVAFCDEPVLAGPPPRDFLERFGEARELARTYGVHLVDWFACDDDQFRAARLMTLSVEEQPDWWDAPSRPGP